MVPKKLFEGFPDWEQSQKNCLKVFQTGNGPKKVVWRFSRLETVRKKLFEYFQLPNYFFADYKIDLSAMFIRIIGACLIANLIVIILIYNRFLLFNLKIITKCTIINYETGKFAKKIIMELAIIGYGRMGHEIESAAIERGHSIRLIIDVDNASDINCKNMAGVDVAIVFSLPSTASDNISACLDCKTPVVSGTTGWKIDLEKIEKSCKENNTSFIHSSNFSIGVNLLFKLNSELAKHMNKYNEYAVEIEELHHVKKLDAPSGTAISLAKGIINESKKYSSWHKGDVDGEGSIPVKSFREGDAPGTHTVKWSSDIDSISLVHDSKSRKGFALGAVIAAEFIAKRVGIFTMEDIMGF